MGKAELFRQTEDHVPDSVLLDWLGGHLLETEWRINQRKPFPTRWIWVAVDGNDDFAGGWTIREATKNAMGVG